MLDANVLVLNRLWQAVNVCSARRAFSLLYQGHAQVVMKNGGAFETFTFDDWKDFSGDAQEKESIKTISFKIKIPQVIALLFYDHMPSREVKFTRKNIYERDEFRCQYCGQKSDTRGLNLDHIIPLARNGKNTWDNVVCSCLRCNTIKGGKTLKEAGMKLIRPPKKPRWQAFISVNFSSIKHEAWRHFLDIAYWNVELGEEAAVPDNGGG